MARPRPQDTSLSLQLNGSIAWKVFFFKIERDAHGFICETEANYKCLRRTVKFNVRARASYGFKFNRRKSKMKILVRSIMRSIESTNRSDQRPMLCTNSPIRTLAARSQRSVFTFVARKNGMAIIVRSKANIIFCAVGNCSNIMQDPLYLLIQWKDVFVFMTSIKIALRTFNWSLCAVGQMAIYTFSGAISTLRMSNEQRIRGKHMKRSIDH